MLASTTPQRNLCWCAHVITTECSQQSCELSSNTSTTSTPACAPGVHDTRAAACCYILSHPRRSAWTLAKTPASRRTWNLSWSFSTASGRYATVTSSGAGEMLPSQISAQAKSQMIKLMECCFDQLLWWAFGVLIYRPVMAFYDRSGFFSCGTESMLQDARTNR